MAPVLHPWLFTVRFSEKLEAVALTSLSFIFSPSTEPKVGSRFLEARQRLRVLRMS